MTRQGVCITASVAALVAMAVMVAFAGAVPANVSGGVSGYTGAEGNAPASFPTPKMKPGFKCTIGYMNPLAANEALQWDQKGAEAEAKALGCKMITLDDALSVDKQVSHMQQLLAEKVNAIIFYPLDPKSTTPVLAQAKKQGVPVVAIDPNFGNPKQAPVAPGIVAQVWEGRDIQAFLQVQALAKALPGAKVGLIGIGAPVPALKYLNSRETYYAKKAGLTVLGTADNPTDDVTGGETAGNGLIQRYPTMNAVIGYNDPSAIGAVIAARSAGRKLTVVGLNGTSDGIQAVKDGRLAATVQADAPGLGRETVKAAYIWATHQQQGVPTVVVLPPHIVTKANINAIPSWAAEVSAIK
jgi:ABC-type sugar transport system substrate-binding protein